MQVEDLINDFNSIKVRLKLIDISYFLSSEYGFQFHKGTIKTCDDGRIHGLLQF